MRVVTKIFAFIFCLGAFGQEIIYPSKQVSIGNHTHTSRDVLHSSIIDSDKNIYLFGNTETDFTFNDIQIIKVDQNLNEIWKKTISFDTKLSYDRVVSSYIDENDQITLVCKSAFNKYTETPVVLKLDKDGNELWRWTLEDFNEPLGIQGFDIYTTLDENNNLILGFKQNSITHDQPYRHYVISKMGELLKSYAINWPDIETSRSITPDVFNNTKFNQIRMESNVDSAGSRSFYRASFKENDFVRAKIDLNNRQKILFERANSELLYDNNGNATWIGYHSLTIDQEVLIGYSLLSFNNETTEFNYFETDTSVLRYVIGRGFDDEGNLIVISKSVAVDTRETIGLLMEKYTPNDELVQHELFIEGVSGHNVLFKDDKILVQASDFSMMIFNHELQLLEKIGINMENTINYSPIDCHFINESLFLSGRMESSMYENSDFLGQKDFNLKKIHLNNEIGNYSFTGLGTSKTWINWIRKQTYGGYTVHITEKMGPDNLQIGGSRSTENSHYHYFDTDLNQTNILANTSRSMWVPPPTNKTEPFELNGSTYHYTYNSNAKVFSLTKDDIVVWSNSWRIGNTNIAINFNINSKGNLIFQGSNSYGGTNEIYELNLDGNLKYIDYPRYDLHRFHVLENDWIFTHSEHSILIFSPQLNLISVKETYLAHTYSASNYNPSLQIGNKVLFSTSSNSVSNNGLSEMHVYDQYGNTEKTLLFKGNLRSRYAFVDGNDLLVLTDEGGFVDHGFRWTRALVSKYGNFIGDVLVDDSLEDSDNDGVVNSFDQCENTPIGNLINEYGCNLIELGSQDFIVQTIDESCFSNDNGKIYITANQMLDYTAELFQDNILLTKNGFTHELIFDELTSGSYQVRITVDGANEFEQVFNLIISEPEKLFVNAKTSLDKKTLDLELKGGRNYIINFNDEIYRTNKISYKLTIEHPYNKLSVKTENDCQGIFEKNIILSSESLVYPNPTEGKVNIYVGTNVPENLQCELYTINGVLIKEKNVSPYNGSIEFNISDLPNGQYYYLIDYNGKKVPYKILKQ